LSLSQHHALKTCIKHCGQDQLCNFNRHISAGVRIACSEFGCVCSPRKLCRLSCCTRLMALWPNSCWRVTPLGQSMAGQYSPA
jgi:hypothetical protein